MLKRVSYHLKVVGPSSAGWPSAAARRELGDVAALVLPLCYLQMV